MQHHYSASAADSVMKITLVRAAQSEVNRKTKE
jgi:hypothetical protein